LSALHRHPYSDAGAEEPMPLTLRFDDAFRYARHLHGAQFRKGTSRSPIFRI
jgi:hypothetical protein